MDPLTPRDIAGNSDDDPSPTDDQLDYSPNHHDDADDDYDTKPGNQASATENNHHNASKLGNNHLHSGNQNENKHES